MKCILVIKGVGVDTYDEIRKDLTQQIKDKDWDTPLFVLLPADYTEIEVVWLDEDMEKALFSESLKQTIKGKLN